MFSELRRAWFCDDDARGERVLHCVFRTWVDAGFCAIIPEMRVLSLSTWLLWQSAVLPVGLPSGSRAQADELRCCCCTVGSCSCGCETPTKSESPKDTSVFVCPCDDLPAVSSSSIRTSFDTFQVIASADCQDESGSVCARLFFDHHLRGPPSPHSYLSTIILLI